MTSDVMDFATTDELEAQLREKDRALHGFASEAASSSSTPFTAPPRPGATPDIGVLPPFASSSPVPSGDFSSIYNSFPPSKSMDPNGVLDFSNFAGGSSLDNLAGVATMLGNGSLADINISTTPELSLNGIGSTFTPGDRSLDLVFISWPPNLPDPDVTKHL